MGATGLNVGTVLAAFTLTVKVVDETQVPELGTKVYVAVVVLLNAGDQKPLIPLSEVVGNGDTVAPEQTTIGLNVGTVIAFTVIIKLALTAHWPTFGVKVYVVVPVLFIEGDHAPAIPFVEFAGKGAKASPAQIGATGLNVGVALGLTFTVTLSVIEVPHGLVAVKVRTMLPVAEAGSV